MKFTLNILLMLILFQSSAQNLVPNPSFENYVICPTGLIGDSISNWYKASSVSSSPDYYNACASPLTTGVPQSAYIYQHDNRNCSGYVGLATWNFMESNSREHIGAELIQPLSVGVKYYLSFATVMGGLNVFNTQMDCPGNNIGIKLSTSAHSGSNPAPINNIMHLYSNSIIEDTVNWIRISGSFIADSAYTHIILGNFFDDANTDTLTLNCATCQNESSYYLMDDVCLSIDSAYCSAGIDADPCDLGVQELITADKQLIKIIDQLGRETEDKPNNLLIYVYSDGTTKKVYRVK